MSVTNGGNKSAPLTVTATTTAGQLLADNPNRRAAQFRNTDASVSVFIGRDNTVTSSGSTKGMELKAGEVYTDRVSRDAWYVITASSTADIAVIEVT